MARSSSVEITGIDKLAETIGVHDRNMQRVILGVFKRSESDAETYAKANAPWTDRTGNARAGLHADTVVGEGARSFEMLVAHSVFYGFWLEVRFSGKYAIIMPTVNYVGALILSRVASAMKQMEAVS